MCTASNNDSLGQRESAVSDDISIGLSVFAWLVVVTNTDRYTYHETRGNRPHFCLVCDAA